MGSPRGAQRLQTLLITRPRSGGRGARWAANDDATNAPGDDSPPASPPGGRAGAGFEPPPDAGPFGGGGGGGGGGPDYGGCAPGGGGYGSFGGGFGGDRGDAASEVSASEAGDGRAATSVCGDDAGQDELCTDFRWGPGRQGWRWKRRGALLVWSSLGTTPRRPPPATPSCHPLLGAPRRCASWSTC
jgi:hypothetical protein